MDVSARILCALMLAASLFGVEPARAADATATGAVHGSVQLLRKSLLRGLRESDDRSGVVVYVTGFTSEAPEQSRCSSSATRASSRACSRSCRDRR